MKKRNPSSNRMEVKSILNAFSAQDGVLLPLLEELPIGIFAKDWSGGKRFFFWNRKMEEIFNIKKEDVVGKTARKAFKNNKDVEYIDKIDSLIVRTGRMMEVPVQHIHLDGKRITIRMKKVPQIDKVTGNTFILGLVEDITSYKESEQKLLQSYREREELEAIISRSPVVLFLFRGSEGFPVEFVSGNVWRFGLESDLFMDGHASLVSLIGESNVALFHEQMKQFSEEVPEITFELYSESRHRWYEATLWPIKRMSFGEKLYQGIFSDITDKKRIDVELREAKKQAEEANAAKSRFLATVTHELRTPLNGILGMASLIKEGRLSPEDRENLGLLKYSAEGLMSLINDLLDFAKIEAKKLKLEWIPVNLKEIVQKNIKTLGSIAQEKQLTLRMEVHSDLDRTVLGDPVRMTQILNNLVGNALKFTFSGEVVVRAMPMDEAPPEVFALLKDQTKQFYDANCVPVYFCVEDTGIGIPKDKMQVIFEPFSQSSVSTSRQFGGTGLGLTICRTLVEKMGGSIWVDSELNKGSRFHYYLLLKQQKMAFGVQKELSSRDMELLAEKYMTSPLKILLAEDNPVNRLVAIKHVERLGWDIFTVENGKKALDAIKANEFDILLFDIKMPVLDGLEAIKVLKNDPSFKEKASLPVLAMTASTSEEEREQFADAGFDGIIPKPFKEKKLKSEILKAVYHRKL
ncbi:MAG: hypothetical protein CR997_02350 [Acidobacteria bacterium]|nr:MAG: hypothetical protein CR997_02350 [Acidobacteriota bacterium]